jgi:hypothetical protein
VNCTYACAHVHQCIHERAIHTTNYVMHTGIRRARTANLEHSPVVGPTTPHANRVELADGAAILAHANHAALARQKALLNQRPNRLNERFCGFLLTICYPPVSRCAREHVYVAVSVSGAILSCASLWRDAVHPFACVAAITSRSHTRKQNNTPSVQQRDGG